MRFRFSISLFMVYLVLSLVLILPIQAAEVSVTGAQGLEGIRETQDITAVEVTAQGNVSIVKDGQNYPMHCDIVSGIYICSHEFPSSTLEPGEYTLNFQQHDPDETFSQTFIVDGQAPQVQYFEIRPQGDQLNISYIVVDTAFDGNYDDCAGITSVSVSTDAQVIYEKTYTDNTCSKQNSLLITPEDITGEQNFYLSVYDAFGLRNESTPKTLSVDFSAPQIQDGVDVFMDNRTVDVISLQPFFVPLVDVQIIVIDDNLSSVRGDLTALVRNPAQQAMYQNYAASCRAQGPQNICTFTQVPLNPGATRAGITITAVDEKGNTVTKTINAEFTEQEQTGQVTYFGPEPSHCAGGECHVTRGVNKIQITVEDGGVGIKPYLITLAVGDLGPLETTKATTCNMSIGDGHDVYTCYAHVPVASMESGTIRNIALTVPTVDLMGTPLQGLKNTKVVVDQDAPQALSELSLSSPCPVAGEVATYSINVSEVTSPVVRIKARPEFITESDYFVNDCENQGDYFACELELSGFVSYAEEEDLTIIVEDLAGTQFSIEQKITTCEANNDVVPEFIREIKTDTDQIIDKRVATFMPVKVYLPLEFVMKNKAAEIIEMEAECGATLDLGGNAYIINKNSEQPVLVVPLGGREKLLEDKILINCTIDVYQTRGMIRYIKPEQQLLIYEVTARNQELGRIDETTQEKLENIQEQLREIDEKIDKRMGYHNVLNTICNIANTLNKLAQIAGYIKALGLLVSAVAEAWGASDAVGKLFETIANVLDVGRIFQLPIGEMSQGAKAGVKTIVKLGCLIYNCGLCSAGGIFEAVNLVSTGFQEFKSIGTQEDRDNAVKKSQEKIDGYDAEIKELDVDIEAAQEELSHDFDYETDLKLDKLNSLETQKSDLELKQAKETATMQKDINFVSDIKLYEVDTDLAWYISEDHERKYGRENSVPITYTVTKEELIERMQFAELDPYKSIHLSKYCVCNSGVIYNYHKQKQLLCRYYSCLDDAATQGLPPAICDLDYDQGKCVYVDSALFRQHNGWLAVYSQIFLKVLRGESDRGVPPTAGEVVKDTFTNSRKILCFEEYVPVGILKWLTEKVAKYNYKTDGWRSTYCTYSGALITVANVEALLENPWSNAPLEPESEIDYCSGLDWSEAT